MEKQILKEPNSVQMIDARAAKLVDYKEFKLDSCNFDTHVTALRLRSKYARAGPITSEHFVIDTISNNYNNGFSQQHINYLALHLLQSR